MSERGAGELATADEQPVLEERLTISAVAELIKRSTASIERDYRAGLFPEPSQFRKRGRRYWLKSTVEAWNADFFGVN